MTYTPAARLFTLAILAFTLALTGCGTFLESNPLTFGTVDVGTEVDVSIACSSLGVGETECVAVPDCSNCSWRPASGPPAPGFTLQVGEAVDLKVTPTGAGPFSLRVPNGGSDAGPDSGTTVDGIGRAVQNLYFTAEPPPGGFVVGESSTVTLRLDASESAVPVEVSSIEVARTVENGTFALSSTSESIAAGTVTTVTATITPATNTSYIATITVTSDDPLAPTQQIEVPVVLLAGVQVERPVNDVIEHQGIDLLDELSQSGGVFTYVVRSTAPVTVEVLGCSTSDESNVTVLLPDGCSPASLETLLDPGGTAEYGLTVNPIAVGEFDFNLAFRTHLGVYEFTVAGEAVEDELGDPDLQITAPDSTGTLEPVPNGSTDAVAAAVGVQFIRRYTISNSGTAALMVAAAVGAMSNATAVVSAAPAGTVAPGDSTTFEVGYTPTATGPFSVALQVTSNDPTTPAWAWELAGTTTAAGEDCGDLLDNDGDSLIDCNDKDDCSTAPGCTTCVDLDLGGTTGVGVFSGGPGDLPMTFSVLPTAGTCWEGSIFQTGAPFDATFEVRDVCGAPPIVSSTDFPIPGPFIGTQFDVTPGNNMFLTVVPGGVGGDFELDIFQNNNTVTPDANLGSALGPGLHTISAYTNFPGQATTANPFGDADAKVDWTAPSDGRFNFIVTPSDPGCGLSATVTPASTCSDIGEIATSSGAPGESAQVSVVLELGDTVRLAIAPDGSSGGGICGPDLIDIEQGEQFCADGADDDGDALIDCADPDCVGVEPCSETSCADGADNDGDALIDCADSDCLNTPACPWDVDIGAATGSPATTADTTGAGDDHLPPCNGNDGNDVLFRWEAPSSGCFTFDTVGSTDLADTVLTVRDENLAVLGCDDDAGPGFLSALQVCSIVGGDTYFIALDAFNASVNGVAPLNITQ